MSKQSVSDLSTPKASIIDKTQDLNSFSLDSKETRTSSHRVKKKKHVRKITHEAEKVKKKHSFDIAGVGTVILSTIVQKVVGCLVGEQVTAENPWTYVRKDLVEDNIELHEGSSEFLALASEIKAYPEPKILIGWIPAASDKHDEFYIVYSVEAKEEVLKVIERQGQEMQERLKRMISRSVGQWQTLGSEEEVNQNTPLQFRAFFEVELNSKFPICNQPIKFQMRKVEDVIDGYVELLHDVRYTIENVKRKRVDISVQAAASLHSVEIQTNATYPSNVGTQYDFNFDMLKVEKKEVKRKMLPSKEINKPVMLYNLIDIFENVFLNQYVDIYKDDYAELLAIERKNVNKSIDLIRFLVCSDPSTSKGKLVGDCAWSSYASGIVAVCYSNFCATSPRYKVDEDEVDAAVCGAPPVLIWSYTDGLEPKLYLESPREITYLSWCPYQKDLLIGGAANGQIIVWDLTDKLKMVESPEILTNKQKQNRLNLLSIMKWMKNTYSISVVEPSIVSNLEFSHKNEISDISWLPFNCEVTRNGKYRCWENDRTRQFMSTSSDGTVLFWDLNVKRSEETQTKPTGRKLKRIKELPAGLKANTTNLKEIGRDFKSHYKVSVGDLPVLGMMRSTSFPMYIPIDPIVDNRPSIRTEYRFDDNQPLSFKERKNILVVTTVGHLINVKMEGYDFDAGKKVNSEDAQIEHYQSLHEGPISFCGAHPTFNDIVLTIGGRIFSIWHVNCLNALLWRKAKPGFKYTTGGWVMRRPACMILIVSDGSIEIWDWILNNIQPVRVISTGGDMILNVFGCLTAKHCRKNTFALSDSLGTVTFYYVPEYLCSVNEDEETIAKKLLERCYERMIILRNWMDKFEENYQKKEEESIQSKLDSLLKATSASKDITIDENEYFSQIDKMNKIFAEVNWNSEEERQMFKTMLDRKKLNLNELQTYKDALQKQVQNKTNKLIKQHRLTAKKQDIFVFETNKIFSRRKHLEQQRRFSMRPSTDISSEKYVEEYDVIADTSLYYIKNHEFHFQFQWSKLMHKGHQIKRGMQDWFKFGKKNRMENYPRRERKRFKTESEQYDVNISSLTTEISQIQEEDLLS